MISLIIAEHNNSQLAEQTASPVTAARAMDANAVVHILVAGSDCGSVADAAAQLVGVHEVLIADNPAFMHRLAEPVSELVLSLAGKYDAILAPATASGKNIMPRIAARLDVMQISDVIEFVAPDTFKRPIYAGNAIQTVQSSDLKKIITVRTTAFSPADTGGQATIESINHKIDVANGAQFVREDLTTRERPELATAKVVVSGGRAFGDKEKFDALLGSLADKLNAAIGASRAAVDSGLASNDMQVGQTGQMVAPDLYIACGISGAIQHVAGMKQSKIIVAVNSDPDAPIFQIADYGLVGDIFTLLPELTEAL